MVNVFDNDALIACDASGAAVDDGPGNLGRAPAGSCGPGDSPSVDCKGFGRIRNQKTTNRRGAYCSPGARVSDRHRCRSMQVVTTRS